MNNNRKKLLITIGVLLAITLLIGASYAYYIFAISQSGSNIVNTDCFRVTFTDGNAINIGDGIPLTDEEAEELTPYTFTIKNVCNHNIDYNVNIETLDNTTMDLDAIKYQIYSAMYEDKGILGSISSNESNTHLNQNVLSSKTIDSSFLMADEEITYNLRLWIGENATLEQSANKIFNSKIVISTSLKLENQPDAMLAKGPILNSRLKSLVGLNGGTMNDEMVDACNDDDYDWWIYSCHGYKYPLLNSFDNWDYVLNHEVNGTTNEYVLGIEIANNEPSSNVETVIISDENSKNDIVAWLDESSETGKYVVKIYSKSDIYLNKDSSYAFSGFKDISNLDLSNFKFNYVESLEGIFFNSGKDDSTLNLGTNFNAPRLSNLRATFMYSSFKTIQNFDKLNTSKVKTMAHLFENSAAYDTLDLSSLDLSNTDNISYMFAGQNFKESDLNKIDTSNVKDMSGLFFNNSNESLNTNGLETNKLTNASNMFADMTELTELNITNLNTSNVEDMSHMFANDIILSNVDLSNLNTSKVKNFDYMFYGAAENGTLDIRNFNTSNAESMSYMFAMNAFTGAQNSPTIRGLDNLNTSKVKNMSHMFEETVDKTGITTFALPSFDTSNVEDMSYMFAQAEYEKIDVSNFNTSKVKNMSHMFENVYMPYNPVLYEIIGLDSFDTSNVEDMSYMFYRRRGLTTLDLSSFDTQKVQKMNNMFDTAENLTTIYASNKWQNTSVTDSTYMFSGCSKLVGGAGTVNGSHIDAEYARVDDPTNGKPGYFTLKTN